MVEGVCVTSVGPHEIQLLSEAAPHVFHFPRMSSKGEPASDKAAGITSWAGTGAWRGMMDLATKLQTSGAYMGYEAVVLGRVPVNLSGSGEFRFVCAQSPIPIQLSVHKVYMATGFLRFL